jgi:hypothetical protein
MGKMKNPKRYWYDVNQRPGRGPWRTTFEADEYFLEGHIRWEFEEGHEILGWKGEGWFAASRPDMEGPLGDVLTTSNMLPVFSERLKAAFEAIGITGLQYLPVKIYKSDYETNPQPLALYYLINILNLVPALDEEKSEFTRTSYRKRDGTVVERISFVNKPVFRSSVLQGLDIIRLPQPSGPIYVSTKIKELFEKNKFTGIGFRPVELSQQHNEK